MGHVWPRAAGGGTTPSAGPEGGVTLLEAAWDRRGRCRRHAPAPRRGRDTQGGAYRSSLHRGWMAPDVKRTSGPPPVGGGRRGEKASTARRPGGDGAPKIAIPARAAQRPRRTANACCGRPDLAGPLYRPTCPPTRAGARTSGPRKLDYGVRAFAGRRSRTARSAPAADVARALWRPDLDDLRPS